MFDRRDFIRTTGAVFGAGLAAGTASAQYETLENYRLVGEAPVPGINEVVARGDWAYAANQGNLTTIDINDPTAPSVAGVARGEDAEDTPDAKVAGDVAALAHNGGVPGISLFDVSDPTNPTFESFYRDSDTVHNCFLKESPDGNVYAYLCISDGDPSFALARMVIVDVTDPANPETLEGKDPSYRDATDLPDEERGTGGAWMLRDARPDMTKASLNPIHDLYVAETPSGNELAYCCFWEAGIVVVDVTEKRHPVAVAHFGAVPYADEQPTGAENLLLYVGGGGKSNAHYVQPTPGQDYTFVGAETFPGPAAPPGEETVRANGDHGGIRVFDTRAVKPLAEGGTAIYPEADDATSHPAYPFPVDRMEEPEPVQNPDPDRGNPDNPVDLVAYIEAPEGADDAALTSHNFDITDEMLFASFYQGGVRAYDLATLYRGGDYEEHARNPREPVEVGAFAPDGTAFWTAVDIDYEEDPGRTFTMGADIGKGAVMLELERGRDGTF